MINDFSKLLPEMLSGKRLGESLAVLPEYDDSIREANAGTRLLRLSDIYRIFIPNKMALEIYHRLYCMASMSMQKKGGTESIRLLNAIHAGSLGTECGSDAGSGYRGIATGMASATCIGVSGIGKTSCIQSAINLCGGVIEVDEPYRKIIPILVVSCPFNCSFRSLCSQILARVDEYLATDYYRKSQKSTMNAEQVMQMVCQVANLFIGVLVIDEIQMIVESRSGSQLYRMILQLINLSNISVLMCGTPECIPFFGQNPQMARRTVGLQYGPMRYDGEFREFCRILFSYQYVRNRAEMSDRILEWLYEHSGAVPGSLTALVHDAQEIAILDGREELGIATLTEAYDRRMRMLHPYIGAGARQDKRYVPAKAAVKEETVMAASGESGDFRHVDIPALVAAAKQKGEDTAAMLKQHISVREVPL